VINPEMSQHTISHPGEPTFLAMSALTIKIPEPIIAPATIEIPSKRLIRLRKRCFSGILRLSFFQKYRNIRKNPV
jgi:hypothetical protein